MYILKCSITKKGFFLNDIQVHGLTESELLEFSFNTPSLTGSLPPISELKK